MTNWIGMPEIARAGRGLRRSPLFTLLVFLTLGVGIGATVTAFAVLNAIVLQPLSYRDSDRLVAVRHPAPGIRPDAQFAMSEAGYRYFRETLAGRVSFGAYLADNTSVTLADNTTVRALTAGVTSTLFDVMSARPAAGRLFTPEDDRRGASPSVVLGYDFWTRQFGGDPAIVNRMVRIGTRSYTVIGVVERGIQLPSVGVDVWLPLMLDESAPPVNQHYLNVIGRVHGGTSVEAIQATASELTLRLQSAFPGVYSPSMIARTKLTTLFTPLREDIVGKAAASLWLSFAAALLVLVIAVGNATALFLVRAERRRSETAVKEALGASRSRVVAGFLGEALWLGGAAAGVAVAIAFNGSALVRRYAPSTLPRIADVHVDWVTVLVAIGCAIVIPLVIGLCLGMLVRPDPASLRGTRRSGASRREHRVQQSIVGFQIGVSVVLLMLAAVLLKSYVRLMNVPIGFDPKDVTVVELDLQRDAYPTEERARQFYRALIDRSAALPGVSSAAVARTLPRDGPSRCSAVYLEGVTYAPEEAPACANVNLVSPGYFATMGIPLSGEPWSWSDDERGTGVAIVSRSFAARAWPSESARDKGLKIFEGQPPYYRVVSTHSDLLADGSDKPPVNAVYLPLHALPGADRSGPPRHMQLIVKAPRVDQSQIVLRLREVIRALDPTVTIGRTQSMTDIVSRSVARTSFTLLLIMTAALLGLFLAAVGLYGTISYVLEDRKGEFALRSALGASPSGIRRLVMSDTLKLGLGGTALGLPVGLMLTQSLRSMLFEVSPVDPGSIATIIVVVIAVALCAAGGPALRASRNNPVDALRGG